MSRHIQYEKEQLVIEFAGLTIAWGLKQKITIPYAAIKGVTAGNFHLPWYALRMGGTSIPNGYKAGRFLYKGEWYFLSYKNPSNVIVLDLEGHSFSKVVLEIGTPSQIRNAILKHCPHLTEQ